ncbi:hypothetical protein [Paenibacillus sp. FSL M7-1046]|uniref:hypothetical protein n=1 Tax=Paenibacillus sp. FSL M7-1046 TaxID=2975315 RepID=UPI0030F74815
MTLGISKTRVEASLRSAGIQDEAIIKVFANIIDKNNAEIEANVKRMIEDATRYLKS